MSPLLAKFRCSLALWIKMGIESRNISFGSQKQPNSADKKQSFLQFKRSHPITLWSSAYLGVNHSQICMNDGTVMGLCVTGECSQRSAEPIDRPSVLKGKSNQGSDLRARL
jgi:hypothetical protein